MDDRRFDIVFAGQIVEGADPTQVQERLAVLFKMGREAIQDLFSGRRYAIKKDLDRATAQRYQAALAKAGALCELAEQRDAATFTIARPGTLLTDPYVAPPPTIDISGLAMLEAGRDVLDEYPVPVAPTLDVSAISMAPAGEVLVAPAVEEAPPPQVGQFTIAEVGAPLCEETAVVVAPSLPGRDHFTLAPTGSDLGGSD